MNKENETLKLTQKEKDLIFIKKFAKTSINKICKELKIDIHNLSNNRISEEKVHIVRKALEVELYKLLKGA